MFSTVPLAGCKLAATTTTADRPEDPEFTALLFLPDRPFEIVAQFLTPVDVSAAANTCKTASESFVLELQLRWEIFVDSKKHLHRSEPFDW